MKLIAKKPCSFGGKKFFIGDEVPSNLVVNAAQQTAWGILEQAQYDGRTRDVVNSVKEPTLTPDPKPTV